MSKLEIGEMAPDFEALDENNEKVRLSDFRGKRVILYFYPKDNTSGCTAQACSFRDAYAELEKKNAVVLGVSPDSVESHRRFRTQYGLPFSLLVDPDHKVAELYGALGEKSMYGGKYMGIIRSQFLIDEEGRIVERVYKVTPGKSVEKAMKVP